MVWTGFLPVDALYVWTLIPSAVVDRIHARTVTTSKRPSWLAAMKESQDRSVVPDWTPTPVSSSLPEENSTTSIPTE